MHATLDDVAKAAKCSAATVSRVLNGATQVSDAVRAKVAEAVRRTAYKPQRKRNGNVGAAAVPAEEGLPVITVVFHRHGAYELIWPEAKGVKVSEPREYHARDWQSSNFLQSNNFDHGLLGGVLAACAYYRVKAEIISTDNLRDPKLLEEVGGAKKGGVIVGGIPPSDGGLDAFLARCRPPVVLLDLLHNGLQSVVTSDNMGGARRCVAHLAGLGHREIGFVGTKSTPAYHERYLGYLAAMAEAGLGVKREFCVDTPGGVAETARLVAPVLSRKRRPTAIVACSDYYAIAAMEAARELGLRVPRDLSLTGFDDIELAQRMKPALTTVRVPVQKLGWLAVSQLLPLPVAGKAAHTSDGVVLRVPVELVERESCAVKIEN